MRERSVKMFDKQYLTSFLFFIEDLPNETIKE